MTITDTRTRWLALVVLCMGSLMIVLDTERVFPLFGLPARLEA